MAHKAPSNEESSTQGEAEDGPYMESTASSWRAISGGLPDEDDKPQESMDQLLPIHAYGRFFSRDW